MEPDDSWHVHESVPLSTPFLPVSLRLNIFSSHLHQFLPSDVMPLESHVPCMQEIPHCICTQFLLLCSEEHPLVYILSKFMLVHTVRHISGRFISILAFIVCLGFCIGHLEFWRLCYEMAKLCSHTVLHTVHRRLLCAQLHCWCNGVTIRASDWQLKFTSVVFCCNRTMLLG